MKTSMVFAKSSYVVSDLVPCRAQAGLPCASSIRKWSYLDRPVFIQKLKNQKCPSPIESRMAGHWRLALEPLGAVRAEAWGGSDKLGSGLSAE